MKLVRCKRCKKMYELISIHNNYCPACTQREYERYVNVRTYVKKNPGITVRQVSEDLGIDAAIIVKYLKEEKLEIAGGTSAFLRCENCGTEISTGRYCQSCKRSISTEENTSITSANRSNNVGMMFTAKNNNH